jgi:hypothetical protein
VVVQIEGRQGVLAGVEAFVLVAPSVPVSAAREALTLAGILGSLVSGQETRNLRLVYVDEPLPRAISVTVGKENP